MKLIDRLNTLKLAPKEELKKQKIIQLLEQRDKDLIGNRNSSAVFLERQIKFLCDQIDSSLLLKYGYRLADTSFGEASGYGNEPDFQKLEELVDCSNDIIRTIANKADDADSFYEDMHSASAHLFTKPNIAASVYEDHIRFTGYNPIHYSGVKAEGVIGSLLINTHTWNYSNDSGDVLQATLITKACDNGNPFAEVEKDLKLSSIDALPLDILYNRKTDVYKDWLKNLKKKF